MKKEPGAGGITGSPCHKYRDLALQVMGWAQGWRPCSVKKIIVGKTKEVTTRRNLAESSKEGYGSKRVVLPMMMMMMTTTKILKTIHLKFHYFAISLVIHSSGSDLNFIFPIFTSFCGQRTNKRTVFCTLYYPIYLLKKIFVFVLLCLNVGLIILLWFDRLWVQTETGLY
jgi:hypothetical protein